jgi:hypothetical protein
VVTIDGDTVGIGISGSISRSYTLDHGPNRIVFRARDAVGHVKEEIRYVERADPDELKPSATVSASTLSSTEATSFIDQVRFLFTALRPDRVSSARRHRPRRGGRHRGLAIWGHLPMWCACFAVSEPGAVSKGWAV